LGNAPCCSASASSYFALLPLDFDLAVFLPSWLSWLSFPFGFSIPDLFEVVLTEAAWRRSASLADRQWNLDISGWSPVLPFKLIVAWQRSAIKGVEGRLASDVLGTSRTSNGHVELFLHDRLAAIWSEGAVSYFRGCIFLEKIGATAAGPVEAFLLSKPLTLHNGRAARAATVDILVEVDVTAATWEPIVLLEAEMLMFVTTTGGAAAASAAAAAAASPHTLEPVAIPSLTTNRRWVVVQVKVSGGRSIHCGRSWVLKSLEVTEGGS